MAKGKHSAGLLMFRRRPCGYEFLLVHPGGPFWARKDEGSWSIPKGLYEADGSERAVFLRHGAVVGIPSGYHPVCAAPGYRLYYLWALGPRAGTARALALHEDPAHRWLHDS